MDIPNLLPDITFPRLPKTPEAVNFSFEVKRDAIGPHIRRRWEWDETYQRDVHTQHFREKPFFEIKRLGRPVGTLSFEMKSGFIRFGEFYLFRPFQAQGIGSAVLAHCLELADSFALPVRLEYLHWNPVGALYRRHGFKEIGRTDIHCLMERAIGSS